MAIRNTNNTNKLNKPDKPGQSDASFINHKSEGIEVEISQDSALLTPGETIASPQLQNQSPAPAPALAKPSPQSPPTEPESTQPSPPPIETYSSSKIIQINQ